MNVHISVNITIRNLFMSCNGKLLFQNKAKAVDIDMFGGIFDVCLFEIMSCFVTGT